VTAAPGFSEDEVLALAAAVERGSEHPLAAAIVAGASGRNVPTLAATSFSSFVGRGVVGRVGDVEVVVGEERFLRERGIGVDPLLEVASAIRREGNTVLFVATGNRPAGIVSVADRIKDSAPRAVAELAGLGIRIVMLTGDHVSTADAVARSLGITEVQAGVSPEQKGEAVDRLRAQGHVVAMAGDGINDAPALAVADVGIAMGTGTDVAIETAAITLVQGDLQGIVRARRLSRATLRNVRQNLFLAFVYNVVAVPLAMSLSSVSVIGNALRLRRVAL
jgi:Cu+-exporting ATPase